jgi:glycosyltransferase involved in cell wall biosynthesis
LYSLFSGLRSSNFLLGEVEFSARRLASYCNPSDFDLVLFEYWHTHKCVKIFDQGKTLCVLDMHDVLWRARQVQIRAHPLLKFRMIGEHVIRAYRHREESAWKKYGVVLAISEGEAAYVKSQSGGNTILLAPMGVDLRMFPYLWAPTRPPIFAFYGGVGSDQNLRSLYRVIDNVMPEIWRLNPSAELLIVGGSPPPEVFALRVDRRIHVTGYVDDVGVILSKALAVICPWSGRYGFRSRIIEAMAIGVPVVVTEDAVWGMGLIPNRGVLVGEDDRDIARLCERLIDDHEFALRQSRLARSTIVSSFSFESTYGRVARELRRRVEG